ncbi:hypothetical protein BD626DRAFT_509213 [Schizophyllum amplum]|uniref:Uncharacterized protein n=1 Tax=Schizophyllum amplum TaxID=97359 RepID=A0A550C2Z1_9AGAR|nr:hypothetical protein BD626DRAFT_509213 [Auriculariopsis ampla]
MRCVGFVISALRERKKMGEPLRGSGGREQDGERSKNGNAADRPSSFQRIPGHVISLL